MIYFVWLHSSLGTIHSYFLVHISGMQHHMLVLHIATFVGYNFVVSYSWKWNYYALWRYFNHINQHRHGCNWYDKLWKEKIKCCLRMPHHDFDYVRSKKKVKCAKRSYTYIRLFLVLYEQQKLNHYFNEF